jgi:hypothetical protein
MRRKHRDRYEAKRRRRVKWLDVIGYALIVLLLISVGYLVYSELQLHLGQPGLSSNSRISRAAVIDQLSSVRPGGALIHDAYSMLTSRGMSTDVYLPNDITVGFYANLAEMGYDLIILRVHTGLGNAQAPIGLFTNEPYDPNRYVLEQANLLLGAAQAGPSSPVVFAVTPKFIRETMQGRFASTIIILGGCYGLYGGDLSQAFVEKGARVVVGWTGLVDLDHTDKALGVFLQSFIEQNMTIQKSVDTTMRTVGADPTYHSVLGYYPTDQGSVSLKSGDADFMTKAVTRDSLHSSFISSFSLRLASGVSHPTRIGS